MTELEGCWCWSICIEIAEHQPQLLNAKITMNIPTRFVVRRSRSGKGAFPKWEWRRRYPDIAARYSLSGNGGKMTSGDYNFQCLRRVVLKISS